MKRSSAFRIGFGYDVHRLVPDRTLILGGVEITDQMGCDAHSDGDVLLHALCDALLGALGKGDIGVHFPNTNPDLSGISSMELLRRVMDMVRAAGHEVGNVDVTVILEKPKIMHLRLRMAEKIAVVLGIDPEDVSIKATTAERLGPIGAGQGIEAHAVALLMRAE